MRIREIEALGYRGYGRRYEFRSHIEGLDLTLTMSDFGVLDIAPAQVDRATGVRQAIGGLGIRLEESIAFGDMPNDLPMLRDAGLSVAMGNGHPDVIAATDVVTASVEDDRFCRIAASTRNHQSLLCYLIVRLPVTRRRNGEDS